MLTSIVILTYNKLSFTQQCIESIREYTDKETYELIVIDNNSTDGTRDWLKEQKDIKVILNEENLGFPKGCNQGIEVSNGDNILLLNNDVIVTENWLNNLLESLYSSENIGAVGPVTNSAAYNTSIPVTYTDLNEMHYFAREFNQSDSNKWEERLKLIGYCMLIKKEVVDEIGLLDEIFTPGNYEDDDYSVRIRRAGYKLLLNKDTFIHHYGSISWKDNVLGYNEVLTKNEQIFMDKWGVNSRDFLIHTDLIDKIPFNNSKHIKVLHIGCAAGGTLLEIKNKFKDCELYGIESHKRVAMEAVNFSTILSSEVDEAVNKLMEIQFDVILITDWNNIFYPKQLLIKLKNILKSDGVLISAVFNPSNLKLIKSLVYGQNPLIENKYMTLHDINKLFVEDCGFKVNVSRYNIGELSSEDIRILSTLIPFSDKEFNTAKYLVVAQKYNENMVKSLVNIYKNKEVDSSLIELNKYEENEVINYIVNKFNNPILLLLQISVLNYRRGMHDKVLTFLQKAYDIDPNNVDTLYNLGMVLYSYNEKDLAKRYLEMIDKEDRDEEVNKIIEEVGKRERLKVLITNHHISQFGGSEINAYQLSKELINKGHEVIVGTFEYEAPICEYFNQEGIPVINLLDHRLDEYNMKFDLIWAHHWTTLDTCIFKRNFNAKKICFSSLSPYESLEAAPIYVNDLDLCLANSFETKNRLVQDGVNEDLIRVFSNFVPQEFLLSEKLTNDNKISKICIVSNHVPDELRECLDLFKDLGVVVDIYGMHDNYQLVTPDILSNYNAVITIGKTVQYALGMGIPVYCYDRFGGPGWINKENIFKAMEFNFSGRCVNRKRLARDIVEEIINNYQLALSEISYCHNIIIENFNLSKMIDEFLLIMGDFNLETNIAEELREKNPNLKRISDFTNNSILQNINRRI